MAVVGFDDPDTSRISDKWCTRCLPSAERGSILSTSEDGSKNLTFYSPVLHCTSTALIIAHADDLKSLELIVREVKYKSAKSMSMRLDSQTAGIAGARAMRVNSKARLRRKYHGHFSKGKTIVRL